MLSRTYEPEELETASGRSIGAPNPETAFFLGPTSESDTVFAFAHKLDGLLFLRDYYERSLSALEKAAIEDQVREIRETLSDAGTSSLSEIVQGNDSLEIYADGYWDEFVVASHPFWPEWIRNSEELQSDDRLWNGDGDDEDDLIDMLEEKEPDDGSERFIFGEPPEDPLNAEFVAVMMCIVPLG